MYRVTGELTKEKLALELAEMLITQPPAWPPIENSDLVGENLAATFGFAPVILAR